MQFLSFTCEDIMVVMATSVSANRKRASQNLAIGVYIINRILHASMWIRILSSSVQPDIELNTEDKIGIHARVGNILFTFLFRNIKTTAVMNQYTVSTRAVRNVFFARTSSHTWRPLASGLWCNVLSVMLVFPNWRRMWVERMFFFKAPLPLSLKKKKNMIRVENSRDALNNKRENRLNLSA